MRRLRGRDHHLFNLFEGQDHFHDVVEGAARHHVDVMDDRVSDGAHSVGHLHQQAEAGRRGEAPATAGLILKQTNEKPELLANELDQEEHRNFATLPKRVTLWMSTSVSASLNLSSAADGECNLVLLLVDAEVVVRRPHRFTGLHVEDVLGVRPSTRSQITDLSEL